LSVFASGWATKDRFLSTLSADYASTLTLNGLAAKLVSASGVQMLLNQYQIVAKMVLI